MAQATLIAERGVRIIDRDELEEVEAPPATRTWFPLKHIQVLNGAQNTLEKAGFTIRQMHLSLSQNRSRFFGTLDLTSTINDGVKLAVGVRNSIDKSISIGFCAGYRVLVCSNLAFSSEIVVSRKHTRNGQAQFLERIGQAVQSLEQFQLQEQKRIQLFQCRRVTNTEAESLILKSYAKKIVSSRHLMPILSAWKETQHQEFAPRTLWSLENAFTSVLTPISRSNPDRFSARTIELQALLLQSASRTASNGDGYAQAI